MNSDGKLRTWGDADFARKLVEFAKIEVDDEPDTLAVDLRQAASEVFGPAPYSYWGEREPARTTRPTSPAR